MIRYTLKCDAGHGFESWFRNAEAFDALLADGRISCPECGSAGVSKTLMAPSVRHSLSDPATDREKALAELRKKVEENSDYVGMNFVTEARKMHQGELPSRAIHGEAKAEDAIKLLEEGVPVAPLPFMPKRQTN